MDSPVKKASHFLKDVVTFLDYALFRLLSGFDASVPPMDVKRILVVERLFMGDLIVITPVFRALKKKYPDAKIDVLIQPSMVDVLSGNPFLSEIIPVSDSDLKNAGKVVNQLKGKYGLGVILNYGTYNISKILRDAGIPYRVGATKAGFLTGRGFFLHRKTRPCFGIKHKVEHHMDVVRSIGIDVADKHLEVFIPKDARKAVDKLLKFKKDDFVVAVHAAPAHKTHQWYADRFAHVADILIGKYNARIVFTGAEKDKSIVESIRSLMKNDSVSAVGKTSIKEYFALIDRADLLISVDTSAMHVGSAVGTPVIALFGAGNPLMWRPYGSQHIVIYKIRGCTGCLRHSCLFRNGACMRAIRVGDVLNAVETILSGKKGVVSNAS
ncbi:MAG: glycosyltransferase family 9 protein [archaeon]